MPAVHSNPYRRPKPSRQDVLFSEKFYRSNENGSYGLQPQKVYVSVCNEYLWVDETLTIPLDSITGTGLSRHGGSALCPAAQRIIRRIR